jgi:CheY-like chemotaxis protein
MKGVVPPREEHLQHVKQNKTRRHLVVDDAEINRRLIQLYLEAKNITVDAVASGPAALEKVEAAGIDGYDVVWTDLSMEGMSGIELTTQLRGLGFQGYVVVLTGNISESAMRACHAAGVDEIFLKPMRKKTVHEMPIMQLYEQE